jgi:hypothetical protein
MLEKICRIGVVEMDGRSKAARVGLRLPTCEREDLAKIHRTAVDCGDGITPPLPDRRRRGKARVIHRHDRAAGARVSRDS